MLLLEGGGILGRLGEGEYLHMKGKTLSPLSFEREKFVVDVGAGGVAGMEEKRVGEVRNRGRGHL